MEATSLDELVAASRQSARLGHHQVGARQAEQALRFRPDGQALGLTGGEEFLVVLPDSEMAPAKAVCEWLRQAIAEHA